MWIEGNLATSNQGDMIDMFDTELVKNACWEIFDDDAFVAPASVVTNGDFAAGNTGWTVGANWSTASGAAVHSPGSTAALTQTITLKSGYYYTVTFKVTASASTVSLTHANLSGALGAVGAGTWTYTAYSTTTSTILTFTPNTLFNGSVDDVSVVQYCAAGHCKVYHCMGTSGVNCDFYMKAENEHHGFSAIELWQGWDVSTHTGVGQSAKAQDGSALYLFRIWARAGAYKFSLHDNYFWFIDTTYHANFVGRPDLYDNTKNIVLIIHGGITESDPNPASFPQNSSGPGWHFLFDSDGNSKDGQSGYVDTLLNTARWKGIDGKYHVHECPLVCSNNLLVAGVLPGYAFLGMESSGLSNGDLVTIEGVDWFALGGTPAPAGTTFAWGLVRKD